MDFLLKGLIDLISGLLKLNYNPANDQRIGYVYGHRLKHKQEVLLILIIGVNDQICCYEKSR